MTRIAILGLDDFGVHLLQRIHRDHQEIVTVDADPSKIQAIAPMTQKAIVGDVRDKETLAELGISDVDAAVVCMGDNFAACVLVVHHIHEIGVPRIIVNVKNEDEEKIVKLIGATEVIHAEQLAANYMGTFIIYPLVHRFFNVSDNLFIVSLTPPIPIIGKYIKDLTLWNRFEIELLGVYSKSRGVITGLSLSEQKIMEDDLLIISGQREQLISFSKLT